MLPGRTDNHIKNHWNSLHGRHNYSGKTLLSKKIVHSDVPKLNVQVMKHESPGSKRRIQQFKQRLELSRVDHHIKSPAAPPTSSRAGTVAFQVRRTPTNDTPADFLDFDPEEGNDVDLQVPSLQQTNSPYVTESCTSCPMSSTPHKADPPGSPAKLFDFSFSALEAAAARGKEGFSSAAGTPYTVDMCDTLTPGLLFAPVCEPASPFLIGNVNTEDDTTIRGRRGLPAFDQAINCAMASSQAADSEGAPDSCKLRGGGKEMFLSVLSPFIPSRLFGMEMELTGINTL